MDVVRVERLETHVMFVRAADDPEAIGEAFARLETALGTLRGRRFFGLFDHGSEEYRACVQVQDGDDPEAFGFEPGTIPGGAYLRTRLRGEPPDLYTRIAPAFSELAKAAECDDERPSIEFYRRRDEVDLLLPVRG